MQSHFQVLDVDTAPVRVFTVIETSNILGNIKPSQNVDNPHLRTYTLVK
jgi:hypothetical protein